MSLVLSFFFPRHFLTGIGFRGIHDIHGVGFIHVQHHEFSLAVLVGVLNGEKVLFGFTIDLTQNNAI